MFPIDETEGQHDDNDKIERNYESFKRVEAWNSCCFERCFDVGSNVVFFLGNCDYEVDQGKWEENTHHNQKIFHEEKCEEDSRPVFPKLVDVAAERKLISWILKRSTLLISNKLMLGFLLGLLKARIILKILVSEVFEGQNVEILEHFLLRGGISIPSKHYNYSII